MDTTSEDDPVLLRHLNIILLTPVIIFGLTGNILSILAWSRGFHRDTSTAALLTALAIIDTIVLTVPATERWFHRVIYFLIRTDNNVTCKIWAFLSYFAPTSSSWIIVLVTAERFISIWFPMRVGYLSTRKKVICLILVMSVIIGSMYMPVMVHVTVFQNTHDTLDIASTKNETSIVYFTDCDISDQRYREDYLRVLMWLDMAFLFMAPFVLIVLGNVLIIYKICQSRRSGVLHAERDVECRSQVANTFTIRAIALSITFLICLLPVTTYQLVNTNTDVTLPGYADDIIHILLYGNSTCNFILYCAIGSGFRKDLRTALSNLCRIKKPRLDRLDSNMSEVLASRIVHT
ncbi:growth hormone secretagogue receptor type 1-like [Ruditapes philippinarum]|uniref:growth hormone secretagogue receptor type 1-like n=1 Tax=Ruditapes philippinarum TaxID=129788 RepID=UPI00295BA702|nr:growth hormone secretagogue receptor type 1-like [Ruditapes philippinarum]